MEVYKRETEEIIRRFRGGSLSYPDCLAALDDALTGVIPYLTDPQIETLREITAAANQDVLEEVERRKLQGAQTASAGLTSAR